MTMKDQVFEWELLVDFEEHDPEWYIQLRDAILISEMDVKWFDSWW